jgi:hypothetical protein
VYGEYEDGYKPEDRVFPPNARFHAFRKFYHSYYSTKEHPADPARHILAELNNHASSAGAFGTRMEDRSESTPWWYSVLEVARDLVSVREPRRAFMLLMRFIRERIGTMRGRV